MAINRINLKEIGSDKQLLDMVYDSSLIQKRQLTNIRNALEGEVEFSDPTSPFIMLLESSAVNTANAAIASVLGSRTMYPQLAQTDEEINTHYSDLEEKGMFATPAKSYFTFLISTMDYKNNAITDSDGYQLATIASGTTIKVDDLTFTLDRDIKIYKHNDIFFVEQVVDGSVDSRTNIGNIPSEIVTDEENISWILFEIPLTQYEVLTKEESLLSGTDFRIKIGYPDKYYYSTIDIDVDGTLMKVQTTHSDIVFDPEIVTAKLTVLDDELIVELPSIYTELNNLRGRIHIAIYTTSGEVHEPLNTNVIEDYEIQLGRSGDDVTKSIMGNMSILCFSRYVLDGGSNVKTLEEKRTKIIEYTTGMPNVPITEYDLLEMVRLDGFEAYKVLDTITSRLYALFKKPVVSNDSVVPVDISLYTNKTSIFGDIVNDGSVVLNYMDAFIIPSGTVFKNANGILLPVDVNSSLSSKELSIGLANTNDYFYTPIYTIVDKSELSVNTSLYELDNPTTANPRIIAKNPNTHVSVNVKSYIIKRVDDGYRLDIEVIGNSEFIKIDDVFKKLVLKLELKGGKDHNIYSVPLVDNKASIFIATNNYCYDDYITLTNGISLLSTKQTLLNQKAVIEIVTSSIIVGNTDSFINGDNNILSRETVDITLGKELKSMWNKMYIEYNGNKYETYEETIYNRYLEDEYGTVTSGGSTYTVKLHDKDDIIYVDGDPSIKHKEGDLVLVDGDPVIDVDSGIDRHMDLLMLPLAYTITDNVSVRESIDETFLTIDKWLEVDVKEYNDRMLDKTELVFRANKTTVDTVYTGTERIVRSYLIKPTIVLYTNDVTFSIRWTIKALKQVIGKIINRTLSEDSISIDGIRQDIISSVGDNLVGIDIKLYDNELLHELLSVDKNTMEGDLKLLVTDELDLEYDIDIRIEKVNTVNRFQ